MANSDPIKELIGLLQSNNFSRQNAECVARVCRDAARLVYERQKLMRKSQLKPKEVSAALILAETLHSSAFRFVAEGHLAHLFGAECTEATALDYFQNNVMGQVLDKYGREVTIDEDGMKSLYKEPGTGAHVKDIDNYEEVRGKRLPWIRHTIQNSDAVYVEEDPIGRTGGVRRKFFYTAIVSIRTKEGEHTSYYVVIAREGRKGLRMVTAFSMFERDGFLHTIAMSQRYVQQNRRVGDKNPKLEIGHQITVVKTS